MTVERTDDELGSATMAGCASFFASSPAGDNLGHRHWGPPKIVLSLIDYFRHKGFFFCSFSNRKQITKARYCKDDSYKRARGRAAAWEGKNYANQARISYFARFGGAAEVAGLVPGGSSRFSVLGSQFSVKPERAHAVRLMIASIKS